MANIKERRKNAEVRASAQADAALEPPRRTSTPFRELTEQEAMELKGLYDADTREGAR
jgi:hypothetical protein